MLTLGCVEYYRYVGQISHIYYMYTCTLTPLSFSRKYIVKLFRLLHFCTLSFSFIYNANTQCSLEIRVRIRLAKEWLHDLEGSVYNLLRTRLQKQVWHDPRFSLTDAWQRLSMSISRVLGDDHKLKRMCQGVACYKNPSLLSTQKCWV